MSTTAVNYGKAIFGGLMLIAQISAFLLFKDLADLSQWWFQSEREFTMTIWYNRWSIMLLSLAALASCIYLRWKKEVKINLFIMSALSFVVVFNIYVGMFNTHLMFRAQQYEGQAKFVSVSDAPNHLEQMFYASYDLEPFSSVDEISVIVLETDQGARAYTDYYLLQPHVVDGGQIGGEDVIMTYCGLTNMGIAYSPVIDGNPLDLRAINQLHNNLLMTDSNTGEPIQQMWGTLERDGQHGPAMKQWPTLRMPFGTFRKLYPDGLVYINSIETNPNPLVQLFDFIIRDGIMVHAVRMLQWQSDAPAFPTITEFDDRLPKKELVYGLNIGDDSVAYTKRFVQEQGGLINVAVGGKALVIYYNQELDSLAAYYNNSGEKVANVDMFGHSDQGPLKRLETLKSGIFWFIWYDFYKNTDLNRV